MDGVRQPQQGSLIEAPNSLMPGPAICSPGLRKLLTQGEDGRSAVRLIAINATLRAEAERLLPMLEEAKAPAKDEEILAVLVRRTPQYGIPARGPQAWAAFFSDYLTALHGLSAYAVEDAFERWNRGEGHNDIRMASFYPKSGQLYILAEQAKRDVFMAAYRARKALEHQDRKPEVWTPERKAEERRKAIEAGVLNADGTMNLPKPRSLPVVAPTRTPHAVAAQLRAVAAGDDVGDVI